MTVDKLGGRKTLKVTPILEEIETEGLKRSIDIVALFEGFGVRLEKKGSSFMGLCPFHDDKNPSLSVDREKGVYHCFGCGEGGDAIELVKKVKGLGFREAVTFLKGEYGPAHFSPRAGLGRRTIEHPSVKIEPPPVAAEALSAMPFLLDAIMERYEKNLAGSAEARRYLEGRGLWKPEVLRRFRVGYSDGVLGDLVGEHDRAELVRLGILKRGDVATRAWREHFERCIVIPLFDEFDHVAGFYGRRIEAGVTPSHLYLPGPHQGLVNRAAATAYRDSLVLTEAILDALSLASVGVQNTIPCYGANGFTEEHEKLLKDERVKEVFVAFDADDAGRKGAAALVSRLAAAGIKTYALEPDHGKDWNDWTTDGGTAEAFAGLVDASRKAAAVETAEEATFTGVSSPSVSSPRPDELTMIREAGRYLFARELVRYRVAGVRESFAASLRVSVRAEAHGAPAGAAKGAEFEDRLGRTYVDTVDLYSARSRSAFASSCAQIGIEAVRIERDLVAMLDALEEERDARLRSSDTEARVMTEEEKAQALELLRDPDLSTRIVDDLKTVGYVGEEVNKLLLYLAATSRKLDDPVSVIVSSQSASGKSYLIDTVKTLMPEEDVVSMTSLSDQALNYLGEEGLLHKFLVMGEAVHSFSVEHQIREMLSAKELSRLVTVKDEKTGEMHSRLVRKKVLVSLAMSTTSSEVNPENSSRFFVISTDESEAQTHEVHRIQRDKYSLDRFEKKNETVPQIVERHRAAQRLLRPLAIVNPYARFLGFPARLMRTRRDHERFLDLIAAAAFLRQYQKEAKQDERGREYVECDMEDYELAYRVMSAILPSTLSNFPRSARELYEKLRELARAKAQAERLGTCEVELSQREIREQSGLSQMFVKRNVRTLCEYEYLVEVGSFQRGSRRGYRLAEDEDLRLVDLSSIPTPEELRRKARAENLDLY